MEYQCIERGIFLARPNRFIAHVEIGGRREICHVKNTGRCRELLIPGRTVYLERSENPARKTKYDLIAVDRDGLLVNMDSQAPNRVFGEWAAENFLPGITEVKPEQCFGDSRFDFRITAGGQSHFVEVKGVTLFRNGGAFFPDAPTERGVKHLRELIRAHESGYGTAVCFILQAEGIGYLSPNDETHPAFGDTLRAAAKAGVGVYAYDCSVWETGLAIRAPIEVRL